MTQITITREEDSKISDRKALEIAQGVIDDFSYRLIGNGQEAKGTLCFDRIVVHATKFSSGDWHMNLKEKV